MAISPGGRPADASPVGTPGGRQNWVDKVGGLPTYIRMVAHALIRKGMSEQRAIATAVNTIKKWAAGADNVRPQVQAAAAKALAEWEAKKGMALASYVRVDMDELLDLAVAEPVMEWALEAYHTPPPVVDLAREYVRDAIGQFAAGAGQGKRPAGGDSDDDGRRRDLPRDPSRYPVDTLADLRKIIRAWAEVPLTARSGLKGRLSAAAGRLDAEPRLRALIAGLGDGDGKAEKGEGSAKAVREGEVRPWLKRQGIKLSDDAVAELIDLAEPMLDLAPGDYRPPYDWKHGYIPITPAAAASKAKQPPWAGKGGRKGAPKGAKLPKTTAAKTSGEVPAERPRSGLLATRRIRTDSGGKRYVVDRTAGTETRRYEDGSVTHLNTRKPAGTNRTIGHTGPNPDRVPDEFKALAKAKDDEARGRGVPGAVQKASRRALSDAAPEGSDIDRARKAAPRSIVKRPADHASSGAANPTGSNGTPAERLRGQKEQRKGTTSMSGKSRPRSAPYDTTPSALDSNTLRNIPDGVLDTNIARYEKAHAAAVKTSPGVKESPTLKALKAEKARRAEGNGEAAGATDTGKARKLAAPAKGDDGPVAARVDRTLSPDAARELSDGELTRRLGAGSSASDADKAVIRAEQTRRQGSTPGRDTSPEQARGITADTAARMSDEQLERAMARLMQDGTYSGPAYQVLEAELDRRDKARQGPADLSKTADQLAEARTKFGVGNGAAVDGLVAAIREKRWDDALQRAVRLQGPGQSEATTKALQKVMERLSAAKRAEGNGRGR